MIIYKSICKAGFTNEKQNKVNNEFIIVVTLDDRPNKDVFN